MSTMFSSSSNGGGGGPPDRPRPHPSSPGRAPKQRQAKNKRGRPPIRAQNRRAARRALDPPGPGPSRRTTRQTSSSPLASHNRDDTPYRRSARTLGNPSLSAYSSSNMLNLSISGRSVRAEMSSNAVASTSTSSTTVVVSSSPQSLSASPVPDGEDLDPFLAAPSASMPRLHALLHAAAQEAADRVLTELYEFFDSQGIQGKGKRREE